MPQQQQKVVELPDGRVVSFPAQMSDEAIAGVLRGSPPEVPDPRMMALATQAKARLPQPMTMREREAAQETNPALAAMKRAGFGMQNIEENVRREAVGFGEGLKNLPRTALEPPRTTGEKIAAFSFPAMPQVGVAAYRGARSMFDWAKDVGEQMGQGDIGGGLVRMGTMGLVGKGTEMAITKAVPAVYNPLKQRAIQAMERTSGIDQASVLKRVEARNAEIADVLGKHKEQVFETMLQRGVAVKEAKAANAANLAKAQAEHAREAAAIVAENEAKWAKQQAAYQQATARQKNIIETAARLTGEGDTLKMALRDNVRAVDAAVTEAVNQKYSTVRDGVSQLGDTPGNSTPILQAVRQAKTGLEAVPRPELMGKIESVSRGQTLADASVFKGAGSGARQGGGTALREFQERFAGPPERLESLLNELGELPPLEAPRLSWQTMQNMYTALGDAMYGGAEIPGYRYHALKTIRDAVGSEMRRVANQAGVGADLTEAQSLHGLRDSLLRDRSKPVRLGGSPLALVRLAEDPAFVGSAIKKTVARSKAMMQQLEQFGADPRLIDEVLSREGRLKSLPNAPKEIKPPVRADKPGPEFVAPKEIQAKLKELPLKPQPEPFNVQEFKVKQLAKAIAEAERRGQIRGHTSTIGLVVGKLPNKVKAQILKSRTMQERAKQP